jgi:hypothetical protein
MPKPIKKHRVGMMAVLMDQEKRIQRMETFLNDLAQDLADAKHAAENQQDSQIVIARPKPVNIAGRT